jgi:F-type H+-transporting ATPase subunit alpha
MLSKLARSQIIRCFSSKKLGIGEATVALEQKISKISQQNDIKEYGTVISIGDGIARVFGL